MRRFSTNRSGRVLLSLALFLLVGAGLAVGGVYLWTEQQLRAARQALETDDFETAQRCLDRFLELRPNNADALFLAARTARRRGAEEIADQNLKACERQEGGSDRIVLERGMLAAQRGALTQVLERSLRARVDRNHPDSFLIMEAMARGYLHAKRLAETGPALNKLLERAPDHFQGHMWRAENHENSGEYVEALPDYEEAVRIRPGSNEARLHLANMLYRVGRQREAVGHFELLRQRDPNKQVLLGLAKCRYDAHQLDEARQLLDAALAQDPKYVRALVERGRIAFRLGDAVEAEEWLQKAIAESPHDRESHLMLYRYLAAQNKKEAADKVLARLDEIDRGTLRSLNLLMRIMEVPGDPEPRYQIGILMLQLGREDEGVNWLLTALIQDPNHGPSHAALADYFERKGQPELAAAHRPPQGSPY